MNLPIDSIVEVLKTDAHELTALVGDIKNPANAEKFQALAELVHQRYDIFAKDVAAAADRVGSKVLVKTFLLVTEII